MNNHSAYAPIVDVTRGHWVESVHRGAIAVVDSSGRLVASLGNPKEPVYLRSAAKPFQALALVCSGAADALGVTEEELAVVCGSHSGEPRHLELVSQLLQRAGLKTSDLHCGIHPPFDPAARRALVRSGEAPNLLHNNCSGKHAGMLAAASYLGLEIERYTDPEHEVQVAIRALVAFLAGMEPDEVGLAVDGCTVPTFLVPLRGFALALARLAEAGESEAAAGSESYDDDLADEVSSSAKTGGGEDEAAGGDDAAADDGFPVPVPEALRRVWLAMKSHPVLVAGRQGRLCTDLMRVAQRHGVALVAKSGAEGVYAIAAAHGDEFLGIALKVEDGAERARNSAALETLLQLHILPEEAVETLAGYHHPPVLNRLDEPVGEVRPRFRLNFGL